MEGAIDERIKWRFFIAVSYTAACSFDSVSVLGYREALETIAGELERLGGRVYLAPREELWGYARAPRGEGIRRDLIALNEAGDFLFFIGGHQSDGALVELGFAIALRKKVWILRRSSETLPSYITGLGEVGDVRFRVVDTKEDFVALAREILGD